MKDPVRVAAGKKTAAKAYKKFGKNYYKTIGKVGGSVKGPGGFGSDPELARLAGAVGGTVSKRGPDTKPRKKRPSKKTEEL